MNFLGMISNYLRRLSPSRPRENKLDKPTLCLSVTLTKIIMNIAFIICTYCT